MNVFQNSYSLPIQVRLRQNEFVKQAQQDRLARLAKTSNQSTNPGWKQQLGEVLSTLAGSRLNIASGSLPAPKTVKKPVSPA